MLAPMQGLTNRGLRALFAQTVRPDVVFTEYVMVRPQSARKLLSDNDRREVVASTPDTPLVVQLIGPPTSSLVDTAAELAGMGVCHINLNLGCPFGRMVSRLSGGNIFKDPAPLPAVLKELRQVVTGSFSVKARSGFEDSRQIFELLGAFEEAEVDFLVLHPRTVKQKYQGEADHTITAELVRATSMPVIANGDIVNAAGARRVRELTGAAGLMFGRGALADPFLFQRVRGRASETPTVDERRTEMSEYLRRLTDVYVDLFCGDAQTLEKLKGALAFVNEPGLEAWIKALRRSKRLENFTALLQ